MTICKSNSIGKMQNRTKIKKTVTQDRTIGIKLDSLKILRYFEIVTDRTRKSITMLTVLDCDIA